MKILLIIAIFCIICRVGARAQESSGVQFETGTTWQQVLEKAKKQHKYIFADCYSTWSAPCGIMDKNIYPDQKAGAFFNSNFISVRVQMDTAKADNEQVKNWYQTAHDIRHSHSIGVYPCFLFFDENGKLVHQGIGYYNVDGLIALGKQAIDNQKQFYVLLDEYRQRKLSDTVLPYMITIAQQIQCLKLADTMKHDFLFFLFGQDMSTILQKKNLNLISWYTQSPQDVGFVFYRKHEQQIDSVLGPGKAQMMLVQKIFGSALDSHTEKTLTVNGWDQLEASCESKYGLVGKAAILQRRLVYYWFYNRDQDKRIKDSLQFRKAFVNFYEARLGYLDIMIDNNLAWYMFNYFSDKTILDMAVRMMELHKAENAESIDTYANLLYKTGQRDRAIEWEKKALALKPENKNFAEVLSKMQADQPTWSTTAVTQ